MSQPDALRALKDSAELLGDLLKAAGERSGEVPQEIAGAAVRVAAAAEILAGDVEEDGSG